MAASRFSDVLEKFYGPISGEENARLRSPLTPIRDSYFHMVRTSYGEWLHTWKMVVLESNGDLLKFAIKVKPKFEKVVKKEIT